MKKHRVLALCVCLVAPFMAQLMAEGPADISYSLGMVIGTNLKTSGLEISPEVFMQGLKDVIAGKKTKFTDAEAQESIQAALAVAEAKKGADNMAAGTAFLEGNRKKAGIVTTASGLQYAVLTAGKGPKPKASDTVKVNYEGKLLNGSVFDSSYARNESATFPLDGVIRGWTEGVQLMPVGSKYRFFVPSDLAYGQQGAGGAIAPNSTLIFEIELLSIEAAKP